MSTYAQSDHGHQESKQERNECPIQNENKSSDQPLKKEESNNHNKENNGFKPSWFNRDGRVENYQQKRETESLIQEHLDYLHRKKSI